MNQASINQSMGFLGDEVVEFLLRDNSVVVKVSSLNHFLQSVVVSQLSEVFSDFSQILKSDESLVNAKVPVF